VTINIRAHFDGKVFVPDESVDLPVDEPLIIQVEVLRSLPVADPSVIEERLRKLKALAGRFEGPTIPDEALRRENLYD